MSGEHLIYGDEDETKLLIEDFKSRLNEYTDCRVDKISLIVEKRQNIQYLKLNPKKLKPNMTFDNNYLTTNTVNINLSIAVNNNNRDRYRVLVDRDLVIKNRNKE